MSKSTARYCVACEDLFEPSVSKIAKYCSADCAYDHSGKNVEQCPWCGDDFDVKFTKTFVGCSHHCDDAIGVNILKKLYKRFSESGDLNSFFLIVKKTLEFIEGNPETNGCGVAGCSGRNCK